VPVIGAQVQPAEVPQLRCPRCWAVRPFVPMASLTFRCTGCEWPFTLAAPVLAAAPAFPATTVTVTSPYPTPVAATITLNAATITSFTISGTAAGAITAGTYIIPALGTFTAVFTGGPPTWAWALPATSASVTAGGLALTFAPTGTGIAYARGQVLIIDPAGTSDVVTVTGTPTATNVPVTSLNAAHNSAVLVTVAAAAPYLSSVEAVPVTAY
jgi:hypothetical protein